MKAPPDDLPISIRAVETHRATMRAINDTIEWERRRLRRHKYYIGVQYKDGYDPATGKWRVGAWPILYKTRIAAEIALSILPVFANAKQFGIKSAAVYSVKVAPFILEGV